jgi:lipopolysaccharide export system permease protein
MSIVNRYLIKEILKYFGIVLGAAVGIYVSVDFFENVDKFMEAGVPISRMIEFFQLKLPLIISQITPVGILLAVLIALGLMIKNNEIIALKSGGMSVLYLLRPIVTLGISSSILLFVLSEMIVPLTISKANRIWRVEVKKYALTSTQKNIWFKGHRSISYISYFNPQDKTISGITLNFFDRRFSLIRRVDAVKGEFQDGHWIFYNVMEQVFNPSTGSYEVKFLDDKVEELDFFPEDLQRVVKKSEEMSVNELLAYIKEIESEGYDPTPYRVDFHGKFALPAACLIICIIGMGLSVTKRIKEGLSISIALGFLLVFLYWITHSFCLSLGYGGLLPPPIAAWISNFIFACIGVFNLINAE